jgi:tetratricopeptide (TPR) repeat protein
LQGRFPAQSPLRLNISAVIGAIGEAKDHIFGNLSAGLAGKTTAPANPSLAEESYAAALQALGEGKVEIAFLEAEKALDLNPESAAYARLYGEVVAATSGQHSMETLLKALVNLDRVVQKGEADLEVFYTIVSLGRALGDEEITDKYLKLIEEWEE